MKIIFVNRGIGIFRGGGEVIDLNIAKELEKLGCEISFISGKRLIGKPDHPVSEFRTDYVSSPYLRNISYMLSTSGFGKVVTFSGIVNDWDTRLFERGAWRILKNKTDYDIVQFLHLPVLASRIVREIKKPSIIMFPGPPSMRYKEYIKGCAAILAYGASIPIIKERFGVDVVDIPPAVYTDLFKPVKNNVRERYGIRENEVLLIFVGRLAPAKNLPFLINCFREVINVNKKIKLMIVGEGAIKSIVERRVKDYGIKDNVIFTGHIEEKELPSYYSAADIFIITSTFESFSCVTLEAMACELPVIATRVGWLPNLVKDDENGILVESNNVSELKNAILNLASDKQLRMKIGKENRKIVKKKHNWHKSAKRLLKVYEGIV